MPEQKVLPHNLEAERAVLAAMLMDREAASVGLEMLGSDGFYHSGNQKIFDAIVELYTRDDGNVDLTTLTEELRRRGDLQTIGGVPTLATILQSAATSANITYHANIVREKSLSRSLIKVCSDVVERGFEDREEIAELLDNAERNIFQLAEKRSTAGFVQVSSLLGKIMEDIETTYKRKTAVTGVPTGYKDLDNLTAGFQNSNLIILAARPSVGKTAFALNLAQNVAMREKIPVAIYSLEMSSDEIIKRILCAEAQVDLAKVRSGYISKEDFGKLAQASTRVFDAPIYIDDSPGLTINEIRARGRRLMSEVKDLGMIVVDYIQLITSSSRIENRQQEVSLISRSLKGMARDMNIPVIALSQLSRAIEKRDDPTPRLSDLRESGAIEQDADVVMFIHRDIYHKQQDDDMQPSEEPQESQAKLIIGKQRNGPTGSLDLYFVKHYTRFESVASQYSDDSPF